jgi:hypothetical protein
MKTAIEGVINRHEAYSKATLLARLGISQRFWDKLLDDGLPYTIVGHTRWITGEALINHLVQRAEHKHKDELQGVGHGTQA